MLLKNGLALNLARIVFSSDRDGNWEIYVMDANGESQKRLTHHPFFDIQPVWSPDGTRIAFVSNRNWANNQIYIMDSDGKNPTRLTDGVWDREPAWSPDGRKIAFAGYPEELNFEIYVMDADGNNPINLTKHKWHDVVPSWSLDGSKIAFCSYRTGAFNDPKHIFVMNADGTGKRNLTGDTGLTNNKFPTWSSDGSKIAFHSQRNFMGYDIYVITAEGKNLERLTGEGDNRFPAYSPDGAKIAFTSTRDGDNNIYLMDTNGRNAVKLTRTPPGTTNSLPSWLPGALVVNPNGKFPIFWGTIKRTGNP